MICRRVRRERMVVAAAVVVVGGVGVQEEEERAPVVDPRRVAHPVAAVGARDIDAREAAVERGGIVAVLRRGGQGNRRGKQQCREKHKHVKDEGQSGA